MSQPLGCNHQQAWPVFSCAIARVAAASRQRLGGLLLGCLSLLLALLLGVEPAAALDRVAVAAFPAAPLQTSRPSAAPPISSPDPLPRRSGARGSVHPPLPDTAPDSPSSLPALFQEALEASRAGRFDLALPLWNRVLERAPEDAAAWSNRGNVQLALGDPLAAIADQDHSLRLEPENADPHLNRGTAEEALGRWDAAAADYGTPIPTSTAARPKRLWAAGMQPPLITAGSWSAILPMLRLYITSATCRAPAATGRRPATTL